MVVQEMKAPRPQAHEQSPHQPRVAAAMSLSCRSYLHRSSGSTTSSFQPFSLAVSMVRTVKTRCQTRLDLTASLPMIWILRSGFAAPPMSCSGSQLHIRKIHRRRLMMPYVRNPHTASMDDDADIGDLRLSLQRQFSIFSRQSHT